MKFINYFFEHHLIRYIFSGGTGAVTNLGILYVLKEFAGLHYLVAGAISFSCAVVVSFLMQKKWTFQDHSTEDTHFKFAIFLTVAIVNLAANTFLLYLFTDIIGFYYLISQIFAGAIVAVWSYFVYKKVFRKVVLHDIGYR